MERVADPGMLWPARDREAQRCSQREINARCAVFCMHHTVKAFVNLEWNHDRTHRCSCR